MYTVDNKYGLSSYLLFLLHPGALAGLSMCVIRSSSISLYVAGKALEVLYMAGVERGWLWSWYYGDVLLYALAVAILLHSVSIEHGDTLRSCYSSLEDATTLKQAPFCSFQTGLLA